MNERRDEPTRLTTGDEPSTPGERWLRRALSEAAVLTARGGESVPARTVRRTSRFAYRRSLQVALAIGVVLLASATFAAFQRFVRPRLAARTVTASEPTERPRATRARAHAPVAPAVSVAETDAVPPPDQPAAAEAKTVERPRRAVERVTPSVAPPSEAARAPTSAALLVPRPRWPVDDARPALRAPAAPDEQNPSEAHVLARAISHLRGAHDAAAALDDLADYDRRFPSGLLEQEVLRIRTEALLDAGRDREALTRLDDRAADVLSRPLRLLRGELRARAGRCEEALDDLGPPRRRRQDAGRARRARDLRPGLVPRAAAPHPRCAGRSHGLRSAVPRRRVPRRRRGVSARYGALNHAARARTIHAPRHTAGCLIASRRRCTRYGPIGGSLPHIRGARSERTFASESEERCVSARGAERGIAFPGEDLRLRCSSRAHPARLNRANGRPRDAPERPAVYALS